MLCLFYVDIMYHKYIPLSLPPIKPTRHTGYILISSINPSIALFHNIQIYRPLIIFNQHGDKLHDWYIRYWYYDV